MKLLTVTLVFKVNDSKVSSFTKELVAKMHKYLFANSVTVHAVDTKVSEV